MTYYKMCLKFELSLGFKDINDVAQACGFDTKLMAKNAIIVRMTQTIPEIPNEDTIKAYEKAILENYKLEHFTVESCHFAGYEYIHPITE